MFANYSNSVIQPTKKGSINIVEKFDDEMLGKILASNNTIEVLKSYECQLPDHVVDVMGSTIASSDQLLIDAIEGN